MNRLAGAVSALLALALCVACGVPSAGGVRTVPADDVPYGLLSPSPTEQPTPESEGPGTTSPQLYLVGSEDLLVPTSQPVDANGLRSVLRQLLHQLAEGPSEDQRQQGLASALGPDIELRLDSVDAGTARVEVSLPTREPAADRLPFAVGQIVLTLTSVAGVNRVLLVRDDEPVELALPGGARTSAPVGADSYRQLVAPDEPAPPKA
ncbi:MAG TPA: GerMN domain-containing protein, partial [Actinomycetales bacterium]|nr:GerMN domain-containing protein [Actinomycetales bacterium]